MDNIKEILKRLQVNTTWNPKRKVFIVEGDTFREVVKYLADLKDK